jgi:hypothetical protein
MWPLRFPGRLQKIRVLDDKFLVELSYQSATTDETSDDFLTINKLISNTMKSAQNEMGHFDYICH